MIHDLVTVWSKNSFSVSVFIYKTSPMWEGWECWDSSLEKSLEGLLLMYINSWRKDVRRMEPDPLSRAQWQV